MVVCNIQIDWIRLSSNYTIEKNFTSTCTIRIEKVVVARIITIRPIMISFLLCDTWLMTGVNYINYDT